MMHMTSWAFVISLFSVIDWTYTTRYFCFFKLKCYEYENKGDCNWFGCFFQCLVMRQRRQWPLRQQRWREWQPCRETHLLVYRKCVSAGFENQTAKQERKSVV